MTYRYQGTVYPVTRLVRRRLPYDLGTRVEAKQSRSLCNNYQYKLCKEATPQTFFRNNRNPDVTMQDARHNKKGLESRQCEMTSNEVSELMPQNNHYG